MFEVCDKEGLPCSYLIHKRFKIIVFYLAFQKVQFSKLFFVGMPLTVLEASSSAVNEIPHAFLITSLFCWLYVHELFLV